MFPLLIRPPQLLNVCHHRPITPPEPSAPQHLWGDPGAPWLPGQRRRQEVVLLGDAGGVSQDVDGLSIKYTCLFIYQKRSDGSPGFQVRTLRHPLYGSQVRLLQPTPSTQLCVCVCVCARSVVSDSVTPWTLAPRTPLSMGFSGFFQTRILEWVVISYLRGSS